MTSKSEAIAVIDQERKSIVRAAGDVTEALREYQKIQEQLDRSMPDCIMRIQGRMFRKKSYWRAIATAFNLSLDCVKEERETPDIISAPGEWGFIVTYKATAPNGRYAMGDGACYASEKKPPQRTIHNIRSQAHTRAMNRAISNLVGFGEVSADEMEKETDEPGSHDGPEQPPLEEPPRETRTMRPDNLISEPQRKRLYAISKASQATQGWTDEELKDKVTVILHRFGYESSTDISREDYKSIYDEIESWK